MRNTCTLQASSSEKLMCLKQELATTAELVSEVLKCKQLKWKTVQHAKAVREKHKDFASLKRKFPSLLNGVADALGCRLQYAADDGNKRHPTPRSHRRVQHLVCTQSYIAGVPHHQGAHTPRLFLRFPFIPDRCECAV